MLADDAGQPRGAAELEKLYEREKAWDELGEVLRASGRRRRRRDQGAGDPAQARHPLHREGAGQRPRDRRVAGAAAAEPENRRAQDALKKLYLQQKNWDALEGFYAAQGKWDEFVRVLERQAETEDDAGTVGLWNKIGELYRDRLQQGRPRAEGLREGAVARRAEPAGGRGADPALREGQGRASGSPRCWPSSCDTRTDRGRAAGAHAAPRRAARRGRRRQGRARSRDAQAFDEAPPASGRIETSRRLAAESGGWAELVEAYEAALPRARQGAMTRRRSCRCSATLAARLRVASSATPRRRSSATSRSWSSRPRIPTRSAALERLYIATGRFADLLAIYDKKLELAKSKAEELEIRFKLAGLYEEEIKQPDKAIELYQRDPQAGSRRSCRRWRRSIASTSSSAAGRSWRRRIDAEIDLSTDMARGRRAQVPARRPPRAAPGRRRGRGRVVPRGAGARAGARRRADRAAGVPVERRRRPAAGGRRGARADLRVERRPRRAWSRSSASSSRTRRRPTSASRCCCGSASSKASSATPTRPGRRTPARSPRAPASAPAREALENLATILDNWQPLVALYEKALSAKGKEKLPSALERELLLVVAVAYDEKLGQSEKAVEYFRRAQSIQPEDASALVALERLYTRTERWSDLVDTLLKKAQLVTDPAEREEIRDPHRHASGRRCSATPSRRSSPGTSSCRTTRATCRRCTRSIASTCARGEYRELADNLQRQLTLSADDRRRDDRRCSGASAPCASSSSASWAARSTPTAKILAARARARPRRSPRSSASCPTRSTSWTSRSCWSRSTRSAATGRA